MTTFTAAAAPVRIMQITKYFSDISFRSVLKNVMVIKTLNLRCHLRSVEVKK